MNLNVRVLVEEIGERLLKILFRKCWSLFKHSSGSEFHNIVVQFMLSCC